MKVVIFAGGRGSRLAEETSSKPKPMVEIGGMPILWHIMKTYAHHGHKEFLICLGYKGHLIKEWFHNYFLHHSDMTIDLASNAVEVHNRHKEDWKVTLVDTGLNTNTAARLVRIKKYIGDGDFLLTYGDGLSDVDINKVIECHNKSGKTATVTAVQPEGRFGSLRLHADDTVADFAEKVDNSDHWINGGFFVLKPQVFDYIPVGADVMWEKEPLERLTKNGQLASYKHVGFWKAMDTLRDKEQLEEMWDNGNPPWKVWRD